jgi:hypothetical protein
MTRFGKDQQRIVLDYIRPLLLRCFNLRQRQYATMTGATQLVVDHIKKQWQSAVSMAIVLDGLQAATDAMTTILDACEPSSSANNISSSLPVVNFRSKMIASRLAKETRDTVEKAQRLLQLTNTDVNNRFVIVIEEEISRLESSSLST